MQFAELLKPQVKWHSFADGSGTVLFQQETGESLGLALPASLLLIQLQDPNSPLWQQAGMQQQLTGFLADAFLNQLQPADDSDL